MSGFDANEAFAWLGRLWDEGRERAAKQESPEEPDEALRIEYGYKLLARDQKIEALEAELRDVTIERDGLQQQLRGMTRVLQRCAQAHDVLYDALYVYGKREMG